MASTTDLRKYSLLYYPLPLTQCPLEVTVPQVTDEEAVRLRDLIERAGKQPPPTVTVPPAPAPAPDKANDRQVGGDHYLTAAEPDGTQHWDRMWRLYREAWFVGNITKYVERYRSKDGLKDLHKARHYLDKLIELETAAVEEWQRKAGMAPRPLPDGLPSEGD